MQVRPDDQPRCPKDTIESFLGHSSMGLLCHRALPKRGKIWKNKCYVSSGSHTHTHTHTYIIIYIYIWWTSLSPRKPSLPEMGRINLPVGIGHCWHCQAYPSCATSARCTRCGRCHGAQLKVGESWEITIRSWEIPIKWWRKPMIFHCHVGWSLLETKHQTSIIRVLIHM